MKIVKYSKLRLLAFVQLSQYNMYVYNLRTEANNRTLTTHRLGGFVTVKKKKPTQ